MQLICELGSGNTSENDIQVVKRMIDGIAQYDTSDVVLKMQLFENQPPNTPLDRDVFAAAYQYAQEQGIPMTASVFDRPSVEFLLQFDVPFVKIACRPSLYPLVAHIPKDIPVYVSYPSFDGRMGKSKRVVPLACVPRYPALPAEYARRFKPEHIRMGVSDHTVGWDLVREYQPEIVEKHVVLERSDDNPDGGPFAVTVEELGEIFNGGNNTRRTNKRRRGADTTVAQPESEQPSDTVPTDL